jgi:hypothetical protein
LSAADRPRPLELCADGRVRYTMKKQREREGHPNWQIVSAFD